MGGHRMIREKLAQSCATMATATRLRDDKAANEKLNTQLSNLNASADKLQTLIQVITAIQDADISQQVLTTEQIRNLRDSIENCGQKADTYDLELSDVISLKSVIENCYSSTEATWKSVSSNLANGVCNSLSSLINLLPNPGKARSLLEKLSSACSKLPSTPQAVIDFVNNIDSAQAIVDTLNLDKNVEAFITKVRLGQATLTDLDSQTLRWIQANHLTNKLKICF